MHLRRTGSPDSQPRTPAPTAPTFPAVTYRSTSSPTYELYLWRVHTCPTPHVTLHSKTPLFSGKQLHFLRHAPDTLRLQVWSVANGDWLVVHARWEPELEVRTYRLTVVRVTEAAETPGPPPQLPAWHTTYEVAFPHPRPCPFGCFASPSRLHLVLNRGDGLDVVELELVKGGPHRPLNNRKLKATMAFLEQRVRAARPASPQDAQATLQVLRWTRLEATPTAETLLPLGETPREYDLRIVAASGGRSGQLPRVLIHLVMDVYMAAGALLGPPPPDMEVSTEEGDCTLRWSVPHTGAPLPETFTRSTYLAPAVLAGFVQSPQCTAGFGEQDEDTDLPLSPEARHRQAASARAVVGQLKSVARRRRRRVWRPKAVQGAAQAAALPSSQESTDAQHLSGIYSPQRPAPRWPTPRRQRDSWRAISGPTHEPRTVSAALSIASGARPPVAPQASTVRRIAFTLTLDPGAKRLTVLHADSSLPLGGRALHRVTSASVDALRRRKLPPLPALPRVMTNDTMLRGESLKVLCHPCVPLALVM